MNQDELRSLLLRRAAAADVALDEQLLERLETYFQLLARWNGRINLTGFSLEHPTDQAIDRLIVEPLLTTRLLRYPIKLWFDLGSGSGSPAIPIQLYRPAETLVLVESKERKAAFLREVIRQMRLDRAQVECTRIESLAMTRQADLVTIRAVRPSETVMAGIRGLLRIGGLAVLVGSEPDRLATQLGFEVLPTTGIETVSTLLVRT